MGDYSVYPRKDSPYWWISYDCPKQLRRRGESSKQLRSDPLGYKRALDLARSRAEDARAEYSDMSAAAWHVWVPGWLELKYGTKLTTFNAEKHRWRWIHAFLREKKVGSPASMTYQLGLAYLEWRQQHKTRSGKGGFNTALGELKMLGRVMREAVRRGFVTASPLERMGLKKQKSAEKPEITAEQVERIRRALAEKEGHLPITKQWMTVSFEIALYQGCRLRETSVPLANIDEKAGTILFRQKGDRAHPTALHDKLRPLIARLREANAIVTCTLPPLPSKHWTWFFKGRNENGHRYDGVAPGLCFHCTRVTVITQMARAGVPIQQAMRYVGHADATINKIYQRLQTPDLARCTSAISF